MSEKMPQMPPAVENKEEIVKEIAEIEDYMAEISQEVEKSETINSCFEGKITVEGAREKFNKVVNEIKIIIAEAKENKEFSKENSDKLNNLVSEMSEKAAYLNVFGNFREWLREKPVRKEIAEREERNRKMMGIDED
jgi:hypothetical protein